MGIDVEKDCFCWGLRVSTDLEIDLEYKTVVEEYTRVIQGEKVVYIDRGKGKNKLLVGLATLMNKGVYAGVKSYYKDYPGDVLCLIDPDNTYYLRGDRGFHIRNVINEIVKDYKPENVVFCGASMAGFAAVDLALFFDANAVVNNPQINLDATYETAWPKLREVLDQLEQKYNLDEISFRSRSSVIGAVFGQHPMDLVNRDALFSLCSRAPGVGLIFGNSHDVEHKYYYQGINGFLKMVDMVFAHRELMNGINLKFPRA